MLELGENIPGRKVLESNQGVYVQPTADSDMTLNINIVLLSLAISAVSFFPRTPGQTAHTQML